METTKNIEGLRSECIIESYIYTSAEEALALYSTLSDEQKAQMAMVYREAFGGYPWFERYQCSSCDIYSPTSICPGCNITNLSEAYPVQELVQDYFPEMLTEFTPGLLVFIFDEERRVVGFSTGGFITVDALVKGKYKKDENILANIYGEFALNPNDLVFYDNETCISPEYQRSSLGKLLSAERIRIASESFKARLICGRTINLRWLNLKERQFQEKGYGFSKAILANDTYEVEGIKRRFYLAQNRS